jgi:hypothetical protein
MGAAMDEMRRESILAGLRESVERWGNAVLAVGIGEALSFAYMIANAQRGLPELITLGDLEAAVQKDALDDLSHKMRKEGCAPPEGLVDLNWTHPFLIRKTDPATRGTYTLLVGDVPGITDYPVLQLLFCDRDGRFAGEEGCDPLYDAPLL